MFVHDIIKIKLSREGYLPNYPPHLISDSEMCDAFLPYEFDEDDIYSGYEKAMNSQLSYYVDNYPLVHPQLEQEHKELTANIAYHLNRLKTSLDYEYRLPDWVYSYMLGATLGVNSPKEDLHDMFIMLNTDNLDDELDYDCCRACYDESTYWLQKLPESKKDHRPPTLFGEPHVIKSLRLKDADMTDAEITNYIANDSNY